jgi:hypothetical protein
MAAVGDGRSESGSDVSRDLRKTIREMLPDYAPPPPATAEESDRIPLPPIFVEGYRVPSFDARHMLTTEGLIALLRQRFPGSSSPGNNPLSRSTPNYALEQLADDDRASDFERLKRITRMVSASGMERPAKELRKELYNTFLRRQDPLQAAMDGSVNHWRR